jgi:hypothetical protein
MTMASWIVILLLCPAKRDSALVLYRQRTALVILGTRHRNLDDGVARAVILVFRNRDNLPPPSFKLMLLAASYSIIHAI